MSLIVKVGKAGKRFLKKYVLPAETCHLSYTRRLERVATNRRICAMTFDDGPMNMPCSPDRFNGRALTDVLLDTLNEFGAKGTFDVIGDTSDNYPDVPGKLGSAAWGGVKYDHYPYIHCDAFGGVVHNDRLVRRMIDEGHQVTSHGYRHIIFGKKPFVYGGREYLGSLNKAVDDLQKLHNLMQETYGYSLIMHRPPHYVDKMQDGFTSYDVCDVMNYQYMAASYDGAGWLPSTLSDENAALEAEVNAMVDPMRKALEQNPDFFCGQIIFQKDGYNMSKRTPVAYGLRKQLELLKAYGYQIVTVQDLFTECPFTDVDRNDPLFDKLVTLSKDHAIVYSDNRLRLNQVMTVGELAMLLAPRHETIERRHCKIRKTGKRQHPYCGAMEYCQENGLIETSAKVDDVVTALPSKCFLPTNDFTRRCIYAAFIG